ncbi:MBL fold metallo-hydrolase [Taklimakanibacter lacteus]|uniref:MBL fold metallo-hydrolase n=1 Tax=Taklimakanibacter lacteus TaxID=2268456 RepID=UPI000E66E18C
MVSLSFDRDFDIAPGAITTLSPLIRRVVADNPGPFTFKGTASFIVGQGDVAIIDPGPDSDAHLANLLAAIKTEKVSHIFVTHSHLDHSPLAPRLQQATGATTVGYGPAVQLDRQDAGALRLDASIDTQFDPDIRLAHGGVIAGSNWSLEGVFTPGHMSNHMSYALKEEKTLFCGDHVMAWATSVIAPPDGNMGQYFASLRLLLERDDAIYHPAHGPPRRDPRSLVRAYLVHRKMREEAIVARLRAGDRSIEEIVKANYADIDPRLHAAAGLSTLAHIEHLIERGLVRRGPDGAANAQYFAT